jgi:hypothetical protein
MAVRVLAVVPGVGPFAGGTRVYVDELTLRVVTYATGAEGKRSVAQLDGWNAGNPEIKCIPFDMLRVLGGVRGATFTESVVRLLGSVTGKNLDFAAGSVQFGKHRVEDIEGAGIVVFDFVVVDIAQELA